MPLYVKLLHDALLTELLAVTPIILLLLGIGLTTAVIQALFQIEDTAFSLLPKIFVMIAIALFGGFGALQAFEGLAILWISHAPTLAHQSWS
ncbi:MAG: hypothetical protein B7W99_00815 [Rhodospirillales bacterium 20-58-10]|nr:MAG: hypothetical protein B7W99_00815 [Rhodospirillales bacterium 20-58-10]